MKILLLMLIYYLILILSQTILFKQERTRVVELMPLFLLFSFSLSLGTFRFNIFGSISTMHVHSTVLLLLMLVFYLINRQTEFKHPVNYFTGLLLIFTLIQVFVLKDILDWTNFTIVVGTYISIFLMGLVTSSLRIVYLNQVLANFNYLAIVNGILSICQYITGKALLIGSFSQSIVYTQGVVNTRRVVGLAGSNNAAGNLGVALFCICLYNAINRKNVLSYAALGITTVFSILTLTRIGYLSIIVAAGIFLWGYRKRIETFGISKWKLLGGISGIAVLFLLSFHRVIIQKLLIDRGNTSGERFKQYANAWKTGVENHFFIGSGIGQWQSYSYYNFNHVDLPIHSLFYNVLVENGIFVFVAFCVLNVYLAVKVIKNIKSYDLKIFYVAFCISMLITVNFNPDQYYYVPNFIYYFVTLLGYQKMKLQNQKVGMRRVSK